MLSVKVDFRSNALKSIICGLLSLYLPSAGIKIAFPLNCNKIYYYCFKLHCHFKQKIVLDYYLSIFIYRLFIAL